MILRKCRQCGCAMDPGEGVNGMCEDCVRQSKALKTRAGQLEALVKCSDNALCCSDDAGYGAFV